MSVLSRICNGDVADGELKVSVLFHYVCLARQTYLRQCIPFTLIYVFVKYIFLLVLLLLFSRKSLTGELRALFTEE